MSDAIVRQAVLPVGHVSSHVLAETRILLGERHQIGDVEPVSFKT